MDVSVIIVNYNTRKLALSCIDTIDIKFCFRLKKLYDFKTIVFPSVFLKHEIGYPVKTFLGFEASAYSAFRTYFLIRNQIKILMEYPDFFTFKEKFAILNNYLFKRLFIILFYEKNKYKKLCALLKGLKEGLLN